MKIVPYAGMTKRKQKEFDAFVEALVRVHCSGIAINILDIPKVFDAAREAWDRASVSFQQHDSQKVLVSVKAAVVNKYRELAKGGA